MELSHGLLLMIHAEMAKISRTISLFIFCYRTFFYRFAEKSNIQGATMSMMCTVIGEMELGKVVPRVLLAMLFISVLYLAVKIMPGKDAGIIYIRADGSIDPPTTPIQRDGEVYTFADDIHDS